MTLVEKGHYKPTWLQPIFKGLQMPPPICSYCRCLMTKMPSFCSQFWVLPLLVRTRQDNFSSPSASELVRLVRSLCICSCSEALHFAATTHFQIKEKNLLVSSTQLLYLEADVYIDSPMPKDLWMEIKETFCRDLMAWRKAWIFNQDRFVDK